MTIRPLILRYVTTKLKNIVHDGINVFPKMYCIQPESVTTKYFIQAGDAEFKKRFYNHKLSMGQWKL